MNITGLLTGLSILKLMMTIELKAKEMFGILILSPKFICPNNLINQSKIVSLFIHQEKIL